MAFIDKTKANYSYKVLQGKAHTGNDRDLVNESIPSGLILSADRIFGNNIHQSPTHSSNLNIVSELVTLVLKPIPGSDSQSLGTWSSYRCYLDTIVPTTLSTVINPLTGLVYSSGDIVGNIIPQSFGEDFRPILYSDSSATIEIPPSDASNWILDPYSGVITQEADNISNMFNTSSNGRLKAYIYIGQYVIDMLDNEPISTDWINSVSGTVSTIPVSPSISDRYLLDSSATGLTFSKYDLDTNSLDLFTASGWEVIEYHTGLTMSGWLVTSPKIAMSVAIESDQNAIYQYYDSSYKRKSFEQTYPTLANKNMPCNLTLMDGDEAASIGMSYTPSKGSYIEVLLNGVQVNIENTATMGALVTSPCYFSNDGGSSHSSRNVRLIKDIVVGDKLYWMGSIAGYQLDTSDRTDWNYVVI